MSEHQSAAKQALLAEAAAELKVDASIGDQLNYVRSYYRHVDASDLVAAGAKRAGVVAAEHADLAAHRPQGRALVRVSYGAEASLLSSRDVIDVVTDDMPFLVDTITMTLAAHDVTPELVVHPQLMVRRDVTGVLHEVIRPIEGLRRIDKRRPLGATSEPDQLAESWSHIEVTRLDAETGEAIAAALDTALADVRMAVEDYPKMRAMAVRLADQLAAEASAGGPDNSPGSDAESSEADDETEPDAPESIAEITELLRWLIDAHFTFLGYREYDLVNEDGGLALRGVPGTGLGILRHDKTVSTLLPKQARELATDPAHRLIMTKANTRATVHRPSYLDYVGIKRLSPSGEVAGEYRFLGLLTHMAYTESITRIPVLKRKLSEVYAVSGVSAESHDGRDVAEFMEVYPREELFQTPVEELADVASQVLRLRERMQTRLFLRKDIYGKYVSCLIYLSRDRYNTKVRIAVQDILRKKLGGGQLDYSAVVDETPIARLHVVVRAEPGGKLADVDVSKLEHAIAAAVRSWDDDLVKEAVSQLGEGPGRALLAEFSGSISETYKADVPAAAAVSDLAKILQMRDSGQDISFEMWESTGYVGGVPVNYQAETEAVEAADVKRRRVWRLTIHRNGPPITLTDVLPRLQHMGVEVVDEHPYEFSTAEPFWIYDFGLRRDATAVGPGGRMRRDEQPELSVVAEQLEGALAALWSGEIEDDDFNALVLDAGLTWRQVVVLRAYANYLRQAGTMFSQDYIAAVLRHNPVIARQLIRLFESRFDPDRRDGESERSEALIEEITGGLDEVASLDEDRILRAYLGLVTATERTSYFREPVP